MQVVSRGVQVGCRLGCNSFPVTTYNLFPLESKDIVIRDLNTALACSMHANDTLHNLSDVSSTTAVVSNGKGQSQRAQYSNEEGRMGVNCGGRSSTPHVPPLSTSVTGKEAAQTAAPAAILGGSSGVGAAQGAGSASPARSVDSGTESVTEFKCSVFLQSEDLKEADISPTAKQSWKTKVLGKQAEIEDKIAELNALASSTAHNSGHLLIEVDADADDPMTTLKFDIEFDFSVATDKEVFIIQRIAESIKLKLRTGDEQLDSSICVVGFWRGSLVLLIQAPDAVIEFIYTKFVVNRDQIGVDGVRGLVSMDPVFAGAVQGAAAIQQIRAAFYADSVGAARADEALARMSLRFAIEWSDDESHETTKIVCIAPPALLQNRGGGGAWNARAAASASNSSLVKVKALNPMFLLLQQPAAFSTDPRLIQLHHRVDVIQEDSDSLKAELEELQSKLQNTAERLGAASLWGNLEPINNNNGGGDSGGDDDTDDDGGGGGDHDDDSKGGGDSVRASNVTVAAGGGGGSSSKDQASESGYGTGTGTGHTTSISGRERQSAEEVAAIKRTLAQTKREGQIAAADAKKKKVMADETAAQKVKQREAAVAKKRAAVEAAEKEHAAKMALIQREFDEAIEEGNVLSE